MISYVALLRGINVGGNNLIKMAELKTCIEQAGLEDVRTYIQSGNVLFNSPEADPAKLAATIEAALAKSFGYKTWVLVKSAAQMKRIVNGAPKGFGGEPAEYRYDVIYLHQPLTAAEAMKDMSLKEGVDQAFAGRNVLYFSRLTAKAASSRLSRIIGTPMYQNMTIRNWNTTVKLLDLLEKE